MRILIVEDEPPIARDIRWQCKQILGEQINSIEIRQTLESAAEFLSQTKIDLLLLDLNLHGENGFHLLQEAVSGSFHTIIISAFVDQAIEAFKYGVLDFLPKPFDEDRLRTAFDRYFNLGQSHNVTTQFITVKTRNRQYVLSVDDVQYFKAANLYVEIVLISGKTEILDKTMDRLEQILPIHFFRIHRSYIVDLRQIESFTPIIDGSSKLTLKSGEVLPLSRKRHKALRSRLNE